MKGGLTALQVIFAIVAVFGAVWESTLLLSLTIPEFMMLYGFFGVFACEIVKRALEWKFPEEELEEKNLQETEEQPVSESEEVSGN